MCHAGHINRAGIRTRYASRYKQLPTPTHATGVHALACIICEATIISHVASHYLRMHSAALSLIESGPGRIPS